MAFTNSRQDLTADTVSTLDLTADTAHITNLNVVAAILESLSLGSDSTTVNKLLFGVAFAAGFGPTALTPLIAHNFGYPAMAFVTVAGVSNFFPYVWVNDNTNVQFGIRDYQGSTLTTDAQPLYYLLIG